MITLEGDSSGFECPHCKEKWWVSDWDTEYNYPIRGYSNVRCPACEKDFIINCWIEIRSLK